MVLEPRNCARSVHERAAEKAMRPESVWLLRGAGAWWLAAIGGPEDVLD